jgi:hypothetical protein
MSKPIRPSTLPSFSLYDSRSTGATPAGRVRDILALKGTMKTR